MSRPTPLRRLRTSTPARVALALIVALLLFLRWRSEPRLSLTDQQLEALWSAPKNEAADLYESTRQAVLEQQRFEPHSAARSVGSPPWTAEGYPTLDARPDVYASRLGNFALRCLHLAPMRNHLDHAVGRVYKQVPPTIATFPRNFYSTHPFGEAGVPDLFRLWNALLPLPLGGDLGDLVPQTEWADPARKGSLWSVMVADASDTETELSAWIGDSLSTGSSEWSNFWRDLPAGQHRSRIFQYMAMLFQGGLFATTDTMPIAHPYLWGLDAKPALHPDLEAIRTVLVKHASSSDSTHRRLWDRSVPDQANWTVPRNVWEQLADDVPANEAKAPRHPATHRLARRAPFFENDAEQPDETTSILSPEINLVVAIEWDSSVAFRLSRWETWSFGRLGRSLRSGPGRSLQFSANVVAAKPYHPVFLDTLATIWAQVEGGGLEKLDPIDVSGAGPFTDAVLRYLLVRYGVTPKNLRNLRGPIRVGDVLILQEGAFRAPHVAESEMLQYVKGFFPMLPGSGVAKAVAGKTLWYWGAGFQSWSSGGRQVVRQGRSVAGEPESP